MNIFRFPNDPSQRDPWLEWIKNLGQNGTVNPKPTVWDLLTHKNEPYMDAHKRALKLIEESRKAEVERALAQLYFEAQVKKALQRNSGAGKDTRYGAPVKTAAELGHQAAAAVIHRRMIPTSSQQYGSPNTEYGTLDLSRAPRPSDSYLRAPQFRPTPKGLNPFRITVTKPEERDLITEAIGNALRTGYYTGQYISDWTDDLFHKAHTAVGKTTGVLAANALATVTGMPRTKWSKEDYLGTVWDRKPMGGRGLGAYLQAKREGRDPSEWFAKAEDADFLYNYNPDSVVGAVAKGIAASTFNAVSPSQLAKAKALEMANVKIGKIKKNPFLQKDIAEGLGAVESWEDFANKLLNYR